jgi:hypothetical protein
MIVGNKIDDDFTVDFDPRISSGAETRKIFRIDGYDDYAVGLHNSESPKKHQHFYIETIVSTEEYEAIDSNAFNYNGFETVMRLSRGESV